MTRSKEYSGRLLSTKLQSYLSSKIPAKIYHLLDDYLDMSEWLLFLKARRERKKRRTKRNEKWEFVRIMTVVDTAYYGAERTCMMNAVLLA